MRGSPGARLPSLVFTVVLVTWLLGLAAVFRKRGPEPLADWLAEHVYVLPSGYLPRTFTISLGSVGIDALGIESLLALGLNLIVGILVALALGYLVGRARSLGRRASAREDSRPGTSGARPVPDRVTHERLYAPDRVLRLFDEMAATYGIVNLISSFGFCKRWRRQCIALAAVQDGMVVYDLMSGMGECWPGIARRLGSHGRIVGVDFCPAMCSRAEIQRARLPGATVEQRQEDFLANSIPDAAADCVVSSFGLKTFSPAQRVRVAAEIARILKPGGSFSLVEISVPGSPILRYPYMLYLKYAVPLIGAAFLGNPDNYRLLGVYTQAFGSCESMGALLREQGLEVECRRLFFGCATALRGQRPG